MAVTLAATSELKVHGWQRQLSNVWVDRVSSIRHGFALPITRLASIASRVVRPLVVALAVAGVVLTAVAAVAQNVQLSVDAARTGAKIDRNIFGQFAEHLGHGVYEGVWVGPDSPIPNTRGIRNDVVAALKALRVPNVRWPGGCFADEYHWRKGIGTRAISLNPNWGG